MLVFAYLLPVAACAVLHLGLGYRGDWLTYLWVLLAGEATVAVLHRMFYRSRIMADEYLGTTLKSIHFEEEWVELVKRTTTRRDSNGRTHTVTTVERHTHPPLYYLLTDRGSRQLSGRDFFREVRELWGVTPTRDVWTGSHISGGIRFGSHMAWAELDDDTRREADNVVSITDKHRYVNKIRNSNSIFKYERISPEEAAAEGLYDYPGTTRHDAPCILSREFIVDERTARAFRRLNAQEAAAAQMRLYVLLFPADAGIGVAERQRAYWQGGNKNEFTLCVGLSAEREVKWARAFSWADEQTLEVEAAQWLTRRGGTLDLQAFLQWFSPKVSSWKRKEFSDFGYISVPLKLWQYLTIIGASLLENIAALRLIMG